MGYGRGEGTAPTGLSELGKTALASIQDNLNGMKTTTETLMPLLGIDQDEKVNMTRRNVATSRVAALLGLGHLVAKSETAELYDEATGATIRGNLMGKARGDMSGASFSTEVKRKDKSKGRKIDEDKEIEVNATGGFQRDLCNLQVLDVICGQMDRHAGNFFVSLNENGELAGLQGIDNDAAFGLNEEVTSAKDQNRHDRAIYDMESGEMTLPYMDENLAERIEELDPDMIRFALKDLLKDAEIEAVIKRLERTKTAVKKTRETQPERFLSDDQWNDDTAQEMINQAWSKYGKFWEGDAETAKKNGGKTVGQENYFGGLMAKTVKLYSPADYGRGEAPQLKRWKEKHQKN